jgi:hypothetical protein
VTAGKKWAFGCLFVAVFCAAMFFALWRGLARLAAEATGQVGNLGDVGRPAEAGKVSEAELGIAEDPVLPIPLSEVPPLGRSLAEIEVWLAGNHLPLAAALRPGLPSAEVDRLLAAAGLAASEELRILYGWHDGQEADGALLPGYRFLPLAEAIEEGASWPAGWLPILWLDSIDFFVVPTARGEGRSSPLYDFFIEDAGVGFAYPSLAAFFAEEAARYREGAYFIDDEGSFELDTLLEAKVHAGFYPGAPALHAVLERSDIRLPDGGLARVESLWDGTRLESLFSARGHLLRRDHKSRWRLLEVRCETVRLDAAGRPLLRHYRDRSNPRDVAWQWRDNGSVTITLSQGGKPFAKTEAREKAPGRLQVLAVD